MFCDGEEDCLHGEDEDGELCYKKEEITKKVQTNVVTGEASTKDPVSSVETETINDDNNFLDLEYLDITIIVVIFFITCVTVVGVCFIIILVMYKVVKTKKKSSFQQLLSPTLTHHTSDNYNESLSSMSVNKSPPVPKKPTWSLRTTSIVKDRDGTRFLGKSRLEKTLKCATAMYIVANKTLCIKMQKSKF